MARAISAQAAACFCLAIMAAEARADMSSAEILERLEMQSRAGAAATRSETRGISVTYGGDEASGEVGGVAAAARSDAGAAVEVAPPADLPPEMPADAQVNIKITFETNSAFIRPGQAGALASLCDAMRAAPRDWAFNVIGHADAAGDDLYNLRLSEARAREVRRYISRECGVTADRISVYGLGETRPLPGVPPVSEDNRRVEIQLDRRG